MAVFYYPEKFFRCQISIERRTREMFFIIQQETVGRDPVQNAIILEVLRQNRYSHSYELIQNVYYQVYFTYFYN